MELPKDLIREFAASTNDQQKIKKDTTCYGTVVIQNGGDFVQIDGADTLTPAIYTVGVKNGDRVLIMLKGRKALVVGNITSPYLMVGTLEANDGIIINGYLTTNPDRTTYDSTSAAGLTISNGGIGAWQGGATTKRWYGKNDGSFYASSAEISGTITAKDGSIGGFTIGENKLHTNQHTTWNANNSGVFISPDYIALGAGGSTYLKNDGLFQFGGANGISFNGTNVTFGESVELNVNRIKGTITNGSWGINFTEGTMSIGTLSVNSITGTASGSAYSGANPWSINFQNGTITIGDIDASTIKAGTISVDRIGSIPNSKLSGSATGSAYSGATAWTIDFKNGTITIGDISASSIKTGTLTVGGAANNTSYAGSIVIKNASNQTIGSWDNTGIHATAGKIGGDSGWDIGTGYLRASYTSSGTKYVGMGISGVTYAFFANASNSSGSDGVFRVGHDGKLVATDATITGSVTASSGSIGGLTLNGNTMYTAEHSTWSANNTGVFISGTGDYPLSIGSGGAFYVTKYGVPHCNGASLYINSAPSVGANSSGINLQISNSLVGEINMERQSATVSNMSLVSYNGGISLDGSTWIALNAPSVNTWGNVKITEGKNLSLVSASNSNPELGAGVDPGDIIFYDSDNIELGRIWNVNGVLNFRGSSLVFPKTTASGTFESSATTSGSMTCYKRGNTVTIEGTANVKAISSRTKIATIPDGYRPTCTFYSFCTDTNRTLLVWNVNGDLQLDARGAGNIWFTVTYILI